ncbi:MAG: polS 1 [Acidimicrobiaceae bacterium]|nr:polS 1 [Acidimicrobiaceae bacterium]
MDHRPQRRRVIGVAAGEGSDAAVTARRLEGVRALVTGAAQGIGLAIATRFADEGAVVGMLDRSATDLESAANAILQRGGAVVSLLLDVRDRAAVKGAVDDFVAGQGGVDALVNCAGTITLRPFLAVDEEAWDDLMDVNCKGTLWCCQAVAEAMIGQGTRGSIVNVASVSGRRGEIGNLAYCATKAAVISMTESMALELAPYGIRVNAIAPGIVATPMWDRIDEQAATLLNIPVGEARRRAASTIPLARVGEPGEIAGTAVFLTSADACYVTRQCINVDGGSWPG